MNNNWMNYLFLITLMFFTLGFLNIHFALLGLMCLLLPFILLFKDKNKTWCQRYCPRSKLFLFLFRGRKSDRSVPNWLTKGKGKWVFLTYFVINFLLITMSTIRVSIGAMEPIEQIRFMIVFPIISDMPQLLNISPVSNWLLHLSYRVYSMMLTTTVFGLIIGWFYLSRTWCNVCPINTLSDIALGKMDKGDVARNNINY